MRFLVLVLSLILASIFLSSNTVQVTSAATITQYKHTTLHVSKSTLLARDPVVLYGHTPHRYVHVYQRTTHQKWHYFKTVGSTRNKWALKVSPVNSTTTHYRVGNKVVLVRSIACESLRSPNVGRVWVNVRKAKSSTVAIGWRRIVCSAAPYSSITIASMFVRGGRPSTDNLFATLRNVTKYRHVHVHFLVQKNQFHSVVGQWSFSEFKKHVPFADVRYCNSGCTSLEDKTSMHSKFMTVSRLSTGAPAVLSSTLNISPQQFDRQNGSAVYVPNNKKLYAAFVGEWRANSHHRSTDNTGTGWHATGPNVSVAFDPSPIKVDPTAEVLDTVVCHAGDEIDVVNANVSRSRLVNNLNRLVEDGCRVRAVFEQYWKPAIVQYHIRHLTTHDKFIIINAHDKYGNVMRQVITGSEDLRPWSMTAAEEQLLLIDKYSICKEFKKSFNRQWQLGKA